MHATLGVRKGPERERRWHAACGLSAESVRGIHTTPGWMPGAQGTAPSAEGTAGARAGGGAHPGPAWRGPDGEPGRQRVLQASTRHCHICHCAGFGIADSRLNKPSRDNSSIPHA